jgi:hypothetical protein
MTALRDPEQAMAALKLANNTRMHIAGFKRDIARRTHRAAIAALIDVLLTPPTEEDGLLAAGRVKHLLCAIPAVGESKAAKMMYVAEIHRHDKRLRELTERQRSLLAGVLSQHATTFRGRRS